MSESKKIITVFGATGNQGGSIIDIVLARPDLQSKYALRGVTRDPSSNKSQALASKGVELVKAELDDVESMKTALTGTWGVFGVTDFWSILDKQREIQQGKNIFDAAKAAGVKHIVFSSLYSVDKMTNGEFKHVDHFDSKAEVAEYIEANKGDIIASFFMPAMFIDYLKQVRSVNSTPTLAMPFPSGDVAWPLIDPRRDSGKYVLGLFEAASTANGVHVHGISAWTTPNLAVAAIEKEAGQKVVFNTIPADIFASFLPKPVSAELTEMMQFMGKYGYYGPGEEKQQDKHSKWLLEGTEVTSIEQWVMEHGPWNF